MKKIHSVRFFLLFLLLALLGLAGWRLYGWGSGIYQRYIYEESLLRQAEALAQDAAAEPLAFDPARLSSLAGQSALNLNGLDQELGPWYPWLARLGNLPWLGPYARQVRPLLNLGLSGSALGQSLAGALTPFQAVWAKDGVKTGNDPIQKRLFDAWSKAQPAMEQVSRDLAAYRTARAAVDETLLPESTRQKLAKVDAALPLLDQALQFAPLAALLAGSETPQSYLVLMQNRDELRPSGGFVSAFGYVRLDRGVVTIMDFKDSTQLDYVDKVLIPPEPIHQVMEAAYWVPRDGNWSPDFPSSARQVQALYFSSTHFPTNGVAAFNQDFLIALMAFLGPITTPDGQVISAANLEQTMIERKMQALAEGDALNRKEFIGEFGPLMVNKLLQTHSVAQWQALGRLLGEQIAAGNLELFANDPQVQGILEKLHMAGQVEPGLGDYVMLVDANLGFSKNDRMVQRILSYDVDLKGPAPQAVVSFSYQNNGAGDEPCSKLQHGGSNSDYYFARCYWDYWRVYLAGQSQLLDAAYQPVPDDFLAATWGWDNRIDVSPGEQNTLVVGGLVVVPQQSKGQVSLQVQLPARVLAQDAAGNLHYKLHIQKEAGMAPLPIQIRVQPPAGCQLLKPSLGQADAQNSWSLHSTLSTALDVELVYSQK